MSICCAEPHTSTLATPLSTLTMAALVRVQQAQQTKSHELMAKQERLLDLIGLTASRSQVAARMELGDQER